MPVYSSPGVYFERTDTRDSQIGTARTDIAGFVGVSARGPLHTPVKVRSWAQFLSTFGGPIPNGFLPCAVQGFFENGGDTCWVVRIANPEKATTAFLDLKDDSGRPVLRLWASSPGRWSSKLQVRVNRTSSDRFTLIVRFGDEIQELWPNLTMPVPKADPRDVVTVLNGKRALDMPRADGVRSDPKKGGDSNLATSPEGKSALVVIQDIRPTSTDPPDSTGTTPAGTIFLKFKGGSDGLTGLEIRHITGEGAPLKPNSDRPLRWGLKTLEDIQEIGIVAIPDSSPALRTAAQYKPPNPRCDVLDADMLPPPVSTPDDADQLEYLPDFGVADGLAVIHEAMYSHCQRLHNRFAILDPGLQELTVEQIVQRRLKYDTDFAALYYPWVMVPDPIGLNGLLRPVPPSGHLAGVYARVDLGGGTRFAAQVNAGLAGRSGVHKSPANEVVEGVKALAASVDDTLYGFLNDSQVNVIRDQPGRGIRAAGARTLSSDTRWLYIAVRRLMLMVMVSIERETQWIPFEPNSPETWRDTERVVGAFLLRLWRRGMLNGASAEEAFFARCDRTTNPDAEIDNGRMVCEIGINPPMPAEFVIVRIGKTENGLEIV